MMKSDLARHYGLNFHIHFSEYRNILLKTKVTAIKKRPIFADFQLAWDILLILCMIFQ